MCKSTEIRFFLCVKIDREHVHLQPLPVLSSGDDDDNKENDDSPGVTEIQIGGLNTSDPRFSPYKSYTGCLSSEYSF